MVTAAHAERGAVDEASTLLLPRALIACGSSRHEPTIWGASHLATQLDGAGFVVEVAVASTHAMPTPMDYELVVAGLSGRPWFDRPLLRWIEEYGRDFDSTIGAFVIGNARRGAREIEKLASYGWQPLATTVLPDHRYAAGEANALLQRFVTRLTLLSRVRIAQGT